MTSSGRVFLIYDHGSSTLARSLVSGLASESFEILGMGQTDDDASSITMGTDLRSWMVQQLDAADVALVIVGEHTFKSKWVEDEIRESASRCVPIVAVKVQRSNVPPSALYGVQARWATAFSTQEIVQVLRESLGSKSTGGDEAPA